MVMWFAWVLHIYQVYRVAGHVTWLIWQFALNIRCCMQQNEYTTLIWMHDRAASNICIDIFSFSHRWWSICIKSAINIDISGNIYCTPIHNNGYNWLIKIGTLKLLHDVKVIKHGCLGQFGFNIRCKTLQQFGFDIHCKTLQQFGFDIHYKTLHIIDI